MSYRSDYARVDRWFSGYPKRMVRDFGPITMKAGRLIEARARAYVPVKTGTLKSTIRTLPASSVQAVGTASRRIPRTASVVVAGGPIAPYAPFQEFGTRVVPAVEFLRRAVQATHNQATKILQDGVLKKNDY